MEIKSNKFQANLRNKIASNFLLDPVLAKKNYENEFPYSLNVVEVNI